jgi:hypothetical protein
VPRTDKAYLFELTQKVSQLNLQSTEMLDNVENAVFSSFNALKSGEV